MKIYIAGKITGDSNYRNKFKILADKLTEQGHKVLNPATMPSGLSKRDYMRICIGMIDIADRVLFMPDFRVSQGAMLELNYCLYTDKEIELLTEV